MKSIAIHQIGNDETALSRFRLARFSVFLKLIESIPRGRPLRILDVGGVEAYWHDKAELMARSFEITLLNIDAVETTNRRFVPVRGSACDMSQFADNSFDVVHSNSVIEHVGQWHHMMLMANEIRRVSSRYFVQTPYFWFPIEPHAQTPFLHWLPEPLRFRLVMAHKCGRYWSKCESVDQAMRTIQSAALVDARMLAALFPDATIVRERWCGLVKSLMAVRSTQGELSHE